MLSFSVKAEWLTAFSLLAFSLLSDWPLPVLGSKQNLFKLFHKSGCTLLSFRSSAVLLQHPYFRALFDEHLCWWVR